MAQRETTHLFTFMSLDLASLLKTTKEDLKKNYLAINDVTTYKLNVKISNDSS